MELCEIVEGREEVFIFLQVILHLIFVIICSLRCDVLPNKYMGLGFVNFIV